jgi:argininosuccinate synthase
VSPFNNQQHINFFAWVGQHTHVHELVYDGAWHHHDLTQISGAPAVVDLVGRPSGYVTSCNNQQHVNFVGDNFHVYELYHAGGGWHHNDLTQLTGAPPAGERVKVEAGSWVSALAGYETTTCHNQQHVIFVGTDRHVHELVYDGAWHHNDLTQLSGAPKAFGDSLVGYETAYDHHQHVIFLGFEGHVHELVYDGAWHHNDLTNLAGAPPFMSSMTRNSLDGYVTSYNNHKHVNFLGDDHHVHELVYDGAWHHNYLTALT